MLRVRRNPELAPLDGNDPMTTHNPRYTVLRTAHVFFAMQLIPDPRTAVIPVVLPKHPLYLNEQLLVTDPPLALGSLLERIIPAP